MVDMPYGLFNPDGGSGEMSVLIRVFQLEEFRAGCLGFLGLKRSGVHFEGVEVCRGRGVQDFRV